MNRPLPSIYDQLYLRLIRPLLNFLTCWLVRPANALERDWLILFRLSAYSSGWHTYTKTAVAIGMLMAGCLGTTGAQAQSPGGVSSSMAWWFKGDAGVTNTAGVITQWNDQGTKGLNMTQGTASRRPVNTAFQNFNPVVTFDGSDALNNATGYWKSSTNNSAYNVFVVAKHTNGTGSVNTIFSENTNQGLQSLFYEYGGTIYSGFWGSNYLSSPFSSSISSVPQVISFRYNNAGSVKQLYFNGQAQTVSSAGGVATFNGSNSNLVLGNQVDQGSWPYQGDIAEIVMYAADLSATQRQQIESYLALKWGTTLNQTTAYNYLNSAGTVIWDATANAGYSNNITGIGKDATSGLDQRQSKSVSANALVTLGNGTGIAATNAANANTLSDQTFELAGDNGLSANYLTAYSPGSFTSVAGVYAMNRIWKVQETGTVGTVTISIPGSTTGTYLLVKNTPSFASGATEIAMTPDGNGNLTAQVNLTDGQYFTFARILIAPGGVVSNLWFRSDLGVTSATGTVTNWTDQAQLINATKIGSNATPTIVAGQSTTFNFNPGIKFSNLQRIGNQTATPLTSGTALDYYMVTKEGMTGTQVFGFNRVAGGTGGASYDNPAFRATYIASRDATLGITTLIADSYSPALSSLNTSITSFSFSTSQYQMWTNGVAGSVQARSNIGLPAQGFLFGRNGDAPISGDDDGFNGQVAEVIALDRNGSLTDRWRIESYLGIKYGVTLPHNYLAADGTTVIYDVSSYSANVMGIGRDDLEALQQKQSKSVNANTLVTIGIGTGLAASNAANANTFAADKSYEVIGDNGLSRSYSAIYTPTSFTPAGGAGFYRMAATWKVQETGTVGTVVIGIASSTGADYLLVSNAATFVPASTTEIQLVSDGKGNLVATIDLTNGQFFTFGAADKAPGGVLAGLRMWLKADALDGNDGDPVATWTSSLLSSPYAVTQASTGAQPMLVNSAAGLANYNQAVYFDGGDELKNATRLYANTAPFSLFTVGIDKRGSTTGSWRATMGIGSNGNDPAMDFEVDGISPNGWNPWMDGSSPDQWSGGNARVAGYSIDNIQGNVAALTSNNIVSGTNNIISYVNGYKETTTLDAYRATDIGNGVFVGSSSDAQYIGLVPEAIAYDQQLSDADVQKVSSYLALKYGITLGQSNTTTAGLNSQNYNYVATDGTVVWNATTNTGYNYDVAGIGLDNFEGLNQKQSKSVNSGFQPAIGLGTVEVSNDANSSSFSADKSYMIWGNNGASSSYSVSYTPSSFTVSAPVYLMNRIWTVQESGIVGTVTISIPGSTTGVYLLVGSSPTSLSAGTATEYAMVADGNGNLTAQVDLSGGQYFTFGKILYAPGGVVANLWYRSDLGVTAATSTSGTISTWTDVSSAIDATQIGTNETPQVIPGQSTTFNFNPGVQFTNMQRIGNRNATPLTSGTALDYYMVTKEGLSGTRVFAFNRYAPGTGGASYDSPAFHPTFISDRDVNSGGLAINDNYTPALSTINTSISSFSFSTSQYQMWINGVAGSVLSRSNIGLPAQGFLFGRNDDAPIDGDDDGFNGQIAEVIALDRNGSLTDRLRIQSYLGIKYGITLPHNYLAADGTTVIYNVSSYSANVTGIGRDDVGAFQQKQSKSVNAAGKLTIGVSAIAADNASNPNSFTNNQSYVVFGDNGLTGLTSFSTVASACPAPPSADKFTRLNYKVTETGSVTAVALNFDASSLGFNSLYPLWMQVATDAAFTNVITTVPMTFSSGVGATTYDFPANSTVYIRFSGNTTSLANVCVAPKTQTFHWNGWNYGTKIKTLYPNYQTQAQTLAGTSDMVMSVTVPCAVVTASALVAEPEVGLYAL